ncbi:MAG: hypothetical protein R3B72_33360 [Polyangiaceae bacterium]
MVSCRIRSLASALVVGGALLLGASSCDSVNSLGPQICDRPETEEPTDVTEGEVIGDTYRSADWDGDLLYFPGGAYYRIHHNLGAIPVGVQFYLSFSRDGVADGSLAPAAGNQVEIHAIDEETITVLNGSCSEYYLMVIAWTEAP